MSRSGGRAEKPQGTLAPGLAASLLAWYDRNARDLPWRTPRRAQCPRPDPYAILVSETMLQQTTVPAVAERFGRWMAAFPSLQRLAAARPQRVLREWEGLGYYARARNLHRAAREIVTRWGGRVPADPDALRALPGVGEYTAGAVASMAFGIRSPALDANVLRILGRLLGETGDPRRSGPRRRLTRAAARLVPAVRPGDFNQALMDLGTALCRPRRPLCAPCPLYPWCRARRSGRPDAFPGRTPRPAVEEVEAALAVVRKRGRILVQRRPPTGLMAGMWEFPGGKVEMADRTGRSAGRRGRALETPAEAVVRETEEETGLLVRVTGSLGVFRHSYTRYRVTLHVFLCSVESGRLRGKDVRWVGLRDLERLPMPAANRRIVKILEETFGPGQKRALASSRSVSRPRSRSQS